MDKPITTKEKILIIDDNLILLATIKAMLVHLGFSVKCCESGENGLLQWQSEEFDGVIVDLVLPGISGLEFLSTIGETKAIIISGEVSSDVGRSLCSKYVFIPKPFTPAQLKETLITAGLMKERKI